MVKLKSEIILMTVCGFHVLEHHREFLFTFICRFETSVQILQQRDPALSDMEHMQQLYLRVCQSLRVILE